MVRFRDLRTGEIVEVTDKPRVTNRRQRRDRFEEITDESITADEVPVGPIGEVLAWVGDDDRRRQVALRVEQAGKQRKGVLEALS